jgi:peptidoglycan/xylan/chitin deacetylase (PgdA/CDA1 family)
MQNRKSTALSAAVRLLAISAAAVFVLAAAAIAFAGTDSVDRTTGSNADSSEPVPVDIISAALTQHADRLTLSVETSGDIDPDQLRASAGAGICWTIAVRGDRSRDFCLARTPGDWALTDGKGKTIAAHADIKTKSVAVSASLTDLKLVPGLADWYVTATPATCVSGASAPVGVTNLTTSATDCSDRAPNKGNYGARIWRLQATGCTATGPHQVSSGPPNKKISLTFDDGPSTYTPAFLKQLRALNVHATFFMIGQQVGGKGKLLKQMLSDGHQIGNHSWNHANLGGGGPAATSQLTSTQNAIKRAAGYTPCVFRPPYGSTGSDLVSRANALGMSTIIWSVDPTDWATPGTDAIVNRVMAQTRKGAIILDHDGGGNRSQTLAAFPQFVKRLRAKGYTFVTLSEQLGYTTKYKLVR